MLCLALGIGANAALFSVLNTVLLRPLPIRSRSGWSASTKPWRAGGPAERPSRTTRDWAAQSTAFEALTAWVRGSRNLQQSREAQRIRVTEATPNLFQMLRARPLLRVVNDVLARWEFLGQNPLGRRILYDGYSLEIVRLACDAGGPDRGDPE